MAHEMNFDRVDLPDRRELRESETADLIGNHSAGVSAFFVKRRIVDEDCESGRFDAVKRHPLNVSFYLLLSGLSTHKVVECSHLVQRTIHFPRRLPRTLA